MTEARNEDFLRYIAMSIIVLFIAGIGLIAFYLILPMYINPLHSIFYSFTYLGFIFIFLTFIFFLLFSIKVQNFTIYIAAIWLSSGSFIFILNQFVYAQFFTDLLLKFFNPLYAVLFYVIGSILLAIEFVRYLYITPSKRL